jgi:hypothetical protein
LIPIDVVKLRKSSRALLEAKAAAAAVAAAAALAESTKEKEDLLKQLEKLTPKKIDPKPTTINTRSTGNILLMVLSFCLCAIALAALAYRESWGEYRESWGVKALHALYSGLVDPERIEKAGEWAGAAEKLLLKATALFSAAMGIYKLINKSARSGSSRPERQQKKMV